MPKPKAKSGQEPKISLDELLSKAATTNHLTGAGIAPAPVEPESGQASPVAPEFRPKREEQKGENTSVAPAAETTAPVAPAPAVAPAPEAALSDPETPVVALKHLAEPTPEPAPASAPEPAIEVLAVTTDAPVTAVPNQGNVPKKESFSEATPEPGSAVEAGTVELATLFTPAADKKVYTMRLTEDHYQYLLLLGTVVGNGASPPDIVHNILAQFIEKNDAQIQKAITRQLRLRHGRK